MYQAYLKVKMQHKWIRFPLCVFPSFSPFQIFLYFHVCNSLPNPLLFLCLYSCLPPICLSPTPSWLTCIALDSRVSGKKRKKKKRDKSTHAHTSQFALYDLYSTCRACSLCFFSSRSPSFFTLKMWTVWQKDNKKSKTSVGFPTSLSLSEISDVPSLMLTVLAILLCDHEVCDLHAVRRCKWAQYQKNKAEATIIGQLPFPQTKARNKLHYMQIQHIFKISNIQTSQLYIYIFCLILSHISYLYNDFKVRFVPSKHDIGYFTKPIATGQS